MHAHRAFAAAIALIATCASAQTLYATTSRRYVGQTEVSGALFVIDAKTANARLIGPVRLPGLGSVGVTGIAVHPSSKLLYGITAGLTSQVRPSLITIDPRSGEAKLIGALGAAATDINFDAKGTLYAWLADANELARVNLTTGVATPVGASGLEGAGGGLAIERGMAYVAANTAAGTLDIVDLGTGAGKPGPALTGAPYLSAINSLAFSPEGELFAVDSNLATPAKSALVVINTSTGAVSIVGELPDDSDGLAFSPDASPLSPDTPAFTVTWVVVAVAGILLFAGLILLRLRLSSRS